MQAWNEFYEKLCKDYGLDREKHFWLHRQSGKYVILHSAVRIIAKKDGIKAIVLQLDETVTEKGTHNLSGAIAWFPGNKQFTAWGTKHGIVLTGPDEEIEMMPELKFKMKFKGDFAASEVGEGDSTNYQGGYKRIIVDKRAYDRAVLELVQHKYEYSIMTDQDAEVMDGVSEQEIASREPRTTEEDTSELARYSNFRRQVQQWIKTVGVETAKKMVASSLATLDTITPEHRQAIYVLIESAESMTSQIDAERASKAILETHSGVESVVRTLGGTIVEAPEDTQEQPAIDSRRLEEVSKILSSIPPVNTEPGMPLGTMEELEGSNAEQLAAADRFALKMWEQEKQYHLKTVVSEMMPEIKQLPDGLRAYLTRVRKAKNAQLEERKK